LLNHSDIELPNDFNDSRRPFMGHNYTTKAMGHNYNTKAM